MKVLNGGKNMIQSNDLRAGMSIMEDGNLYQIMGTSQNKTAQRQMIIKAKVKNMRTGSVVELSFIGGSKVELAHIDKRDMQYLYDAGEAIVFMDEATFEQIEISKENLEWELNFMTESSVVTVIFFQTEVLGVDLPEKISLKVIETEPAVKGDTTSNAQKYATVETGYETRVPLFVNQGDHVVLSTTDGKYQSRG